MGKNDQKLRSLFEHYLTNLNLVRQHPDFVMSPARTDIIFCPLCIRTWYSAEVVNWKSDTRPLSLEHIPPAKFGGREMVITCKKCNNDHGSVFDSRTISYVRENDALSGHGERFVTGYLNTEEGARIRIVLRLKPNANSFNVEMYGIPEASNPKYIRQIEEQLRSNSLRTFTTKIHRTNPRYANLGMIRTAYLIAFRCLGYGFLLNANISRILVQLANPEKSIFPEQAVLWDLALPDDSLGINVIYEPSALKSYFIVFDVQDSGSIAHRVGVMLPGPNVGNFASFEHLDDFADGNFSFVHRDIGFGDKNERPFLAHDIWNEILD